MVGVLFWIGKNSGSERTRRRERVGRNRMNNDDNEDEDEDAREAIGEKTQDEIAAEKHVVELGEKVETLTEEAEAAMRALIDYSDELRAQDALFNSVIDKASKQVPPRHGRARSTVEDEDEERRHERSWP